ncbi:MAG TPA: GNVR domain-containing protein [Candidatus Polarisedimenticolaceae bacterium]
MSGLPIKTLLDAAWRRKWWILVPPIVGLLVSTVLLQRAPKVYRAATTVLVVPQRVPETFVRTTVTAGLVERLSSIQVQILGPSYLDRVLKDLRIVGANATDEEVERARAHLRANVQVTPDTRRGTYFQIAVKNSDPKIAAAAANMLADLFIAQNSLLRTEQASTTRAQTEKWLAEKKKQLDDIDARLATYRREHYGELPDQQATNLQLIAVAQQRLTQIDDGIRNREARIAMLQSQLQTMESINAAAGLPTTGVDPNLQRLALLEQELTQLKLRYADVHPDVRAKAAQLEEFKKTLASSGGAAADAEGGAGGNLASAPIRAELRQLNTEITRLHGEREQVNARIDQITGRVRNTPLREQELSQLTRDYNNLQQEYQTLLRNRDEATRAEQLEAANQSEHFRVQDRAGVPSVPFSPQPLQLILMGLLGGLAVGVGIAFGLEQFDQSMRTEEAFRSAFPDVPLLGTVPNLLAETKPTPGRRTKLRKSAAVLIAIGVAGLAAAGWL